MLTAAAYNFKKLMRQLLDYLRLFFLVLKSQLNESIPNSDNLVKSRFAPFYEAGKGFPSPAI